MKNEKIFSRVAVAFCFATLIVPLATGTLFVLTLIKVLDDEKMKFIQSMIGDCAKSGLIAFAIVFFLATIVSVVLSSLVIAGGLSYRKRIKRGPTTIENRNN
jgi:hypothetical protein